MIRLLTFAVVIAVNILSSASFGTTTAKVIATSRSFDASNFYLGDVVVLRPIAPGALPDVTVLIPNAKLTLDHQPEDEDDSGLLEVLTSSRVPKASARSWLSREIRSSVTLGLLEASRTIGRRPYMRLGSETNCGGNTSIWNALSNQTSSGCSLEIQYSWTPRAGYFQNSDEVLEDFLHKVPCSEDPSDVTRMCNDPVHPSII